MIYEIWCNGKLHYTRPEGHPDIQEALDLIEKSNRLFGVSAYEVRPTQRAADEGYAPLKDHDPTADIERISKEGFPKSLRR